MVVVVTAAVVVSSGGNESDMDVYIDKIATHIDKI
jgi:hypothetical protein